MVEEKEEVLDINSTRLENESFEDYKERRKKVNKITKEYLKGRIFWPGNFPSLTAESWNIFLENMTKKHGTKPDTELNTKKEK